jgi:hypothetical protein
MVNFIPGRRSNLKRFIINNESKLVSGNNDYFCQCFQDKFNRMKTGYNEPSISQGQRISILVKQNLGGRTQFGNLNGPALLNYLNRGYGQPGGSMGPLRNKF